MKSSPELFIERGHKTPTTDHRRFIPIHDLYELLGRCFTQVLSALHVLTGCDSVSAIYGIGEKTALDVLKRGLEKHQSLLFKVPMRHIKLLMQREDWLRYFMTKRVHMKSITTT